MTNTSGKTRHAKYMKLVIHLPRGFEENSQQRPSVLTVPINMYKKIY